MKKISRRAFAGQVLKAGSGAALIGTLSFSLNNLLNPQSKKLGVALVGLGSYSTYQLAPALQQTQYAQLTGIVTGTPAKEKIWSEKYQIPQKNIYNYNNFDSIVNNPNIDLVYVVLPNSMHAEFSIRAAKAGKHVICEKPMAMRVKECDEIISACRAAGVKLSVGYRMQSDPYTQEIKRLVREKPFGKVHYTSSDAAYISRGNPNQWRLNKALSGGGALMNMGVYALQSAIYGTGRNPVAVLAQEFSSRPEYFKETDETITAQLEFSEAVMGHVFTSHNANANRLYVSFESGWAELNPCHSYGPLSGRTSEGKTIAYPFESQQKKQLDDFAKHILFGNKNRAPGEMGKRDMIIVEAIYRSIREGGKKIPLELGNLGIVFDKKS